MSCNVVRDCRSSSSSPDDPPSLLVVPECECESESVYAVAGWAGPPEACGACGREREEVEGEESICGLGG